MKSLIKIAMFTPWFSPKKIDSRSPEVPLADLLAQLAGLRVRVLLQRLPRRHLGGHGIAELLDGDLR